MMAPALMTSPPEVLTPRRFECESRPLRELPPAFLCAILLVLAVVPTIPSVPSRHPVRCPASRSAGDIPDQEFGIALAMPLMLLIMLATTHLEDADLLAAA